MSAPPDFLPYGRQWIDDDDVVAVEAVLRGDFLTTGPAVGAFEEAFAAAVGARFAVACSSGTAGLHLACLALGIGPGDRAIVPSLTFLATANAPRLCGADVSFADVGPDDALMRVADAECAREAGESGQPRVVLPVHFNGQCASPEALHAWARDAGVHVVEDACHAIGTRYVTTGGETVRVGSCRHSDLCVFSLHPVKAVAMGEGGVVTTNDEGLRDRLVLLRGHGMVRDPERFELADRGLGPDGQANPWYYEMQALGLNYRASDIHCALGRSQLRRLGAFIERRRELAAIYDEALGPLAPAVIPFARAPGCTAAWHFQGVLVDFAEFGRTRTSVMASLRAQGVGTQVHYIPVHGQPYYRRLYGERNLPGAERFYARELSLPLFPAMRDGDVARVVTALQRALED